jgi:peptidoglycan hydrolase-like protein with peptidoglycan-binding domain
MPSWRAPESARSFFTHVDTEPAAEQPPDERRSRRRTRVRRGLGALAATGLVSGLLAVLVPTSASADPSADDWYRLRMCESSNNYQINTGNGYYGAYQFDLPTWRSVGGTGLPSEASKAEQDKRALMLYHQRGWQPWTCARIVGLTGGGSASAPDSGSSAPIHTAHGWPGVQYKYGDHSRKLVKWQKQMRKRGATILHGTGEFGPKTRLVAKTLQRQNGLPAGGTIGPKTWELAWTGKFTATAATREAVAKPSKPTHAAPKPPATKKPTGTTKPPTKKPTKPAAKPKPKPATKPTTKPAARPKVPAWPGVVYGFGQKNAHIAQWQKQMAKRGAALQGTGEFGKLTYATAKALQKQNGLPALGYIGPKTWALAWTGAYQP